MMPTARPYAYIRRSVTSRGDPGDQSRDFQTDTVRQLAGDDAPGLIILDGDWGRSAAGDKTTKRLDFLRLLDLVERGEVSHLYAYAPDRLSRSVEWSARLVNACRRAGVPITTTAGTVAPDDPGGRMLFNMLALVNENALDQIAQKRASTVRVQRAKGATFGQKPYGSKPGEDVGLVIDAFKRTGTYNGAARALNDAGVKSARGHLTTREGVPLGWEPSAVRRIVLRTAPELIPMHPAKGARTLAQHRLTRLLLCPHDGSLMTTILRHDRRSTTYICRVGERTGDHPRPFALSEGRILPAIQRAADRVTASHVAVTDAGIEVDITALAAKRERVIAAYVDGLLQKGDRDARLAAIDDELAGLEGQRRARLVFAQAVDWSADPGTINAALRSLWRAIRLEYRPSTVPPPPEKHRKADGTRVKGRHTSALDLVAVGAYWRVPPTQAGERDEHGVADEVPIGERQEDGTWYVPFEA